MSRIERRLLILWLALAVVVWNGVYDMRMHDTMRGYLLESALAQGRLEGGVDMRTVLRRGLVDAVAFSTAWALGVFLAGMITMWTYRRFGQRMTIAARRSRTDDKHHESAGLDSAPLAPPAPEHQHR
jgi:hypothetical protein